MATGSHAYPGAALPNRYEVRDTETGRLLRCKETPGIAVNVQRTHSFSDSEARKLGEQTILLDGAGHFGPLIDTERMLYNLDHHEGCVRTFTLAACEQALLLVVKGLQLDKGTWTVYANEPDLDTVFAIWVLLNHRRLRELTPHARDRILPLLRLESAIDANGFDVADYCGLPTRTLAQVRQVLDRLQEIENRAKASGEWGEIDLADYTMNMLLEIDHIVYESSDFQDFASVEEEYEHVGIGDDRVAVVCRDASGIYEVEQRLKNVWGDKLGIIALEKDEGNFTLRRAAALAKIDLGRAYARLNLVDPAVDGRPPGKRWGGSDEIGGSPRPTGTGLTPKEIAAVLHDSFRPVGWLEQLRHLLAAVALTLGLVVLVGLGIYLARSGGIGASHPQAVDWGLFAVLTSGLGYVLLRRFSHGKAWLFGLRRPAGRDWWLLAPAVLAGALLGAAWTPRVVEPALSSLPLILAVAVAATLSAEIWFRGFVHGIFVFDAPIQSTGGSWFLSRAAAVSAVLYAAVVAIAGRFLLGASPLALIRDPWDLHTVAGALLAGLALGMIRERSRSIWPGVLLQIVGSLLVAGARFW